VCSSDLPETSRGNLHLLTIVDAFSGFAVTAAMKNQAAETVCNVLMEKIVAPFGCPLAILSDQGRQFEGRIFSQLCDMMEIEKNAQCPTTLKLTGRMSVYIGLLIICLEAYLRMETGRATCHSSP
jgi:transposase InsO family protein